MRSFKGKSVAVDSMIVIYILEQHPDYGEKIAAFLDKADRVILSSLVYGEVLTGLYRIKAHEVIDEFLSFVESSPKVEVHSFDTDVAFLFAKIRATNKSVSPPDCIHLATALQSGADLFLTNDKRLKSIEGIEVAQLGEVCR